MSTTILQSFKIFKITDGISVYYIEGSISESSNCSPKTYDSVYFNAAAKDAETLSLHAVNHARSVVNGCTRLKNGNGISVDDDVHTIIRRYRRNLKLAKTVLVDKIVEKDGWIGITPLADSEDQFVLAAPGFSCYLSSGIRVLTLDDVAENKLIDEFLHSKKTIADALPLIARDSCFASLVNLSKDDADEDIAKVLNGLNEFYLPRMIEAWSKVKGEEEILSLMSDEKLDGLSKYCSLSKACQSIKHKREITRNAERLDMALAGKANHPSKVMKI